METRQLFPMVADLTLRSRLLQRVLEIPYMIPSLYTFFEDTKWLEPCAKILRSLLPPGCRENTRASFYKAHNGSARCQIQQNSTEFSKIRGTEAENVERSYIQLWMFAWRHFPELSGIMPRRDVGFPKPQPKTSNLHCLHQFAKTAARLGFESSPISDLRGRNPDMDMAHQFLREARPGEFYTLSEEARNCAAQKICEVLSVEWVSASQHLQPTSRWGISPDHRCGRPYEQSHNDSKTRFFFQEIYGGKTEGFSCLSVHRDIFLGFFGTISGRPHVGQDCRMDDGADIAGEFSESGDEMDQDYEIPADPGIGMPIVDNAVGVAGTGHPDGSVEHGTQNEVSGTNDVILFDAPADASAVSYATAQEPPTNDVINHDLVSLPLSVSIQLESQDTQTRHLALPNTGGSLIVTAEGERLETAEPIPDAVSETLHQSWERLCAQGCLFFVWMENLAWRVVERDEPIPDEVLSQSTGHYYKTYLSQSKHVGTIPAGSLLDWARDRDKDGVIYTQSRADKKHYHINGGNTEARLSYIMSLFGRRNRSHEAEDEDEEL